MSISCLFYCIFAYCMLLFCLSFFTSYQLCWVRQ